MQHPQINNMIRALPWTPDQIALNMGLIRRLPPEELDLLEKAIANYAEQVRKEAIASSPKTLENIAHAG